MSSHNTEETISAAVVVTVSASPVSSGATSTVDTPIRALTLEEEDTEEDENQAKSRGRGTICWSSMNFAFSVSIVTLGIGIALLVLSFQAQQNQPLDSADSRLSPDESKEYWLFLKDTLLAKSFVLIPGSAPWKTLQWLVLHDPLRPLTDPDRLVQRYTLVVLYHRWGGTGWNVETADGWTMPSTDLVESPPHECDWKGVRCDDGRVRGLLLNGESEQFRLRGSIGTEIGALESLVELDLSQNGPGLKGSFPSEIQNLRSLTALNARQNGLTSVNFEHLARLSSLQWLDLGENALQGEISHQLTHLTQIKGFSVSANEAIGGNPFQLVPAWKDLEVFDVSRTRVSGQFPDDFSGFPKLRAFIATLARFNGTIPTSIGICTELETLVLTTSVDPSIGLSGSIPTELGNLKKLRVLSLAENRFNSTIPTSLANLRNLETLSLHTIDQLHGTLPPELGNLVALTTLRLHNTALSGEVPTSIGQLTNLNVFQISRTSLEGEVPQEVCQLQIRDFTATCNVANQVVAHTLICDCCLCLGN